MMAGILLASGLSRRFGSQKLLFSPGGGKTLFEQVLSNHLRSGLDPLVVVVSEGMLDNMKNGKMIGITVHERGETNESEEGKWLVLATPWGRGRLVVNEDPERGMARSLQEGLSVLSEEEKEEGVLISLADMPGITPSVIERVVTEYRRRNAKILVPTYRGQIGHPVVVHEPTFRKEIAEIEGDVGLRHLLRRFWEEVETVPWGDPSVVMDIDTPSDVEKVFAEGGWEWP